MFFTYFPPCCSMLGAMIRVDDLINWCFSYLEAKGVLSHWQVGFFSGSHRPLFFQRPKKAANYRWFFASDHHQNHPNLRWLEYEKHLKNSSFRQVCRWRGCFSFGGTVQYIEESNIYLCFVVCRLKRGLVT